MHTKSYNQYALSLHNYCDYPSVYGLLCQKGMYTKNILIFLFLPLINYQFHFPQRAQRKKKSRPLKYPENGHLFSVNVRTNGVVLFYQKVITKANIGLTNHTELQQVKNEYNCLSLSIICQNVCQLYYILLWEHWEFFFSSIFWSFPQFPGTGTMVSSIGG